MPREPSLQDRREYVRVTVDLPLHPKLASLDDPSAGWLYVVSLCYSGEHLTDGSFSLPVVARLAGVASEVGKKLISVGMWHEHGHECPKCPQPAEGMVVVHDYLRHQRSRSQAEQVRAAGRTAANARWGGRDANRMRSASGSQSGSHADRTANGMRTASEPHLDTTTGVTGCEPQCDFDATPNAKEEVEEEEEKYVATSPSVGGSGGDASQQAAPPDKKPPRSDRGARVAEGWRPTPETIARLRAQYPNLPDDWWRRTHERFMNHWLASTGRNARKISWDRTFSNWVHEQVDRERVNGRASPGKPSKDDEIRKAYEKAAQLRAEENNRQPEIMM